MKHVLPPEREEEYLTWQQRGGLLVGFSSYRHLQVLTIEQWIEMKSKEYMNYLVTPPPKVAGR